MHNDKPITIGDVRIVLYVLFMLGVAITSLYLLCRGFYDKGYYKGYEEGNGTLLEWKASQYIEFN